MALRTTGARPHFVFEELETRIVPAGYQPTEVEQLFLERLNDAREDPQGYGESIGLNLAGVNSSQPLAFDTRLIQAARLHSQDMNDNAFFSHISSSGQPLVKRMEAAGFSRTSQSESIAAGWSSAESALQGLIIDRGVPSLGHRHHLLAIDEYFQDMNLVGVGIVMNGDGPWKNYFTIDTAEAENNHPYLTGAVFNDLNENGKYDLGEAVGNLNLEVQGVGSISTFESGGFSFELSPGTYSITFSGDEINGTITKSVTIGNDNVRLNILTNLETPDLPPVDVPPGEDNPPVDEPPADGHSQDTVWINEVSLRLLGRAFSKLEISNWEAFLQNGGSREAFLITLLDSDEFERVQLTRWVSRTANDILGRELSSPEKQIWTNFLQAGGTREMVVTVFMNIGGYNSLSSKEWVSRLAQNLFHRNLSSFEIWAWSRYLDYGGSQSQIIQVFMNTAEYKQLQLTWEVADWGMGLLGEPLTELETQEWVRYLQKGGSRKVFLTTLVNESDW